MFPSKTARQQKQERWDDGLPPVPFYSDDLVNISPTSPIQSFKQNLNLSPVPQIEVLCEPEVDDLSPKSPQKVGLKHSVTLNKSRDVRALQTAQECICIALLNKYCSFSFKQPAKKSTVAPQFLRICKVTFSVGDEVDFEDIVKKRCLRVLQDDIIAGIPSKTAQRRFETNKKTEMIHLLIDMLREFGYFFQTRMTVGKSGTVKAENIIEIWKSGIKMFGCKDIEEKGVKVSKYLADQGKNEKEFIIKKNNQSIQKAIV
ncbi:hypothetical protein EIN_206310 [Entamoeba invadens IP1]|uniref:Uncharacterized protein n=1 Tax=Entamoeba invadens IP1 TaxID=370355 RepID=A0A0A1U9P3_ENTIV|nr:hypothetical protein EIN_206310 [Entamoeba invadens IP1]ELP91644.1 hypothetical protein EIN_206310 [Entamoeba invadens IP1]|eukprot:XP_004258415.1 hypothetical protein EIN_206310 [Entamoeba invadens IP1]